MKIRPSLSADLIGEVLKLEALEVIELADRGEAKERLADGKVDVVAFIGPRYHEKVEELDTDVIFAKRASYRAGCGASTLKFNRAPFWPARLRSSSSWCSRSPCELSLPK